MLQLSRSERRLSSERRHVCASVCTLILLSLAACGGEMSPTAPALDQPLPPAATFGASTSAISGQLMTGGSSAAAGGGSPKQSSMAGIQITLAGTSKSTNTDANGAFVLIGVSPGNARLEFSGPGTNAALTIAGIGEDEVVQLTIALDSTSARVVSEHRDRTGEFEGELSDVDVATGRVALRNGTVVYVDPNTWWDSGGDILSLDELALADQAGQIVELEGRYARGPGNILLATAIKAETDGVSVEVEGFVVSVNRALSSFVLIDGTVITVVPGTTEWRTDGDYTSFDALASAVEAGVFVEVEVEGALQDDGSVLADRIKADNNPFELEFKPDEWDLGWVGSGSPGTNGSGVRARIEDGPFEHILASSVEMEGPSGITAPVAFDTRDDRFTASFRKADAIGVVGAAVAGDLVTIVVRGTLTDGTPWELSAEVEIVDEDDEGDDDEGDDDDDGGGNDIPPEIAEAAIARLEAVIDEIQRLVGIGAVAANHAEPWIKKIESAIDSLKKLNGIPAVNKLEALLNQLEAAEKTGKLHEDDLDHLEELIEDVIDLIED